MVTGFAERNDIQVMFWSVASEMVKVVCGLAAFAASQFTSRLDVATLLCHANSVASGCLLWVALAIAGGLGFAAGKFLGQLAVGFGLTAGDPLAVVLGLQLFPVLRLHVRFVLKLPTWLAHAVWFVVSVVSAVEVFDGLRLLARGAAMRRHVASLGKPVAIIGGA